MTKIEQEVIATAKLWRMAQERADKAGSPYSVSASDPTYGDRRALHNELIVARDRLYDALLKLEGN